MDRSYFFYRAFLFLITGGAFLGKVLATTTAQPIIYDQHPLVPVLSTSQLVVLGQILDTSLLLVLILSHNKTVVITSALSVYCAFGAYHLAVILSGISYDCHCFGRLHELFGLPAATSKHLARLTVVITIAWGLRLTLSSSKNDSQNCSLYTQ
jgi:hypothetical protein